VKLTVSAGMGGGGGRADEPDSTSDVRRAMRVGHSRLPLLLPRFSKHRSRPRSNENERHRTRFQAQQGHFLPPDRKQQHITHFRRRLRGMYRP
jgi:hypothetical protein